MTNSHITFPRWMIIDQAGSKTFPALSRIAAERHILCEFVLPEEVSRLALTPLQRRCTTCVFIRMFPRQDLVVWNWVKKISALAPFATIALLPYSQLDTSTARKFEERWQCLILDPRPTFESLLDALVKSDSVPQPYSIRLRGLRFQFRAIRGDWVDFPPVGGAESGCLAALATASGFVSRVQLAVECACDEWSVKTFIMRLRTKYSMIRRQLEWGLTKEEFIVSEREKGYSCAAHIKKTILS
jgi:hypothetical protein